MGAAYKYKQDNVNMSDRNQVCLAPPLAAWTPLPARRPCCPLPAPCLPLPAPCRLRVGGRCGGPLLRRQAIASFILLLCVPINIVFSGMAYPNAEWEKVHEVLTWFVIWAPAIAIWSLTKVSCSLDSACGQRFICRPICLALASLYICLSCA